MINKILRKAKDWNYKRIHGFYPIDVWSLDYAILQFTLPRLKQFSEDVCSFPNSMYYDDPDSPRPEELDENHYTETDSHIACNKWKGIVDKMIYSIEAMIVEGDGTLTFFKNDENGDLIIPLVADTEKEEKVQEGWELFHKYFFALWN